MSWKVILLVLIFLTVAGVNIGVHWYMNTEGAGQIREWYCEEDAHNRKRYNQGIVTFVIPCVLLGLSVGVLAARWNPSSITVTVLLMSVGIVALLPVYARFFPSGMFSGGGIRDLVIGVLKTVALCGFMAYGAKVMAIYLLDGRDITTE